MSGSDALFQTGRRGALEAARLAALQPLQCLDGATVAAFERLAAYTAGCMDADAAAVAFVDGAEVFLAGACGIGPRRWARAGSFFDTVVCSGVPLLVEDADRDQRFCEHALVAGSDRMRSFAGVPILDADDQVLGVLGGLARVSDRFSPAAISDLAALARGVQRYLSELPSADLRPEAVQGWLGVRTVVSRDPADRQGLIVVSVASGSPADQAGLRPTDVLLAIDGQGLWEADDIVAALSDRIPGTVATVDYLRVGVGQTCYVTIERRRPSMFSRRRS